MQGKALGVEVGRATTVGLDIAPAEAGAQAARLKARVMRTKMEKVFCIQARFNAPGHPGVV